MIINLFMPISFAIENTINDTKNAVNSEFEEENLNMNNDKKVLRLCNGVHPSRTGYNQIADCVFAYIKNKLSSE